LFDLGAFTLWPGGRLVVSDRAHGTEGFHEALLCHHDLPVRPPQRPEWGPGRYFLDWHGREVFKGEPQHRHP
jgi:putative restriction endonuclease